MAKGKSEMLTAKKFAERGRNLPGDNRVAEKGLGSWGRASHGFAPRFLLADSGDLTGQCGEAKAGAEAREEVEEGGGMSRVRIHDLTKELKPEIKKSLEIARRMGIAEALNVTGPRRKPPTKKPKKEAK
jgi:hypothetical protein